MISVMEALKVLSQVSDTEDGVIIKGDKKVIYDALHYVENKALNADAEITLARREGYKQGEENEQKRQSYRRWGY